MYKCGGGGGGGGGGRGSYGSAPFFGGLSGHPEGNDIDEVSFDDNGIAGGSSGAAQDDSENDVFSGIDNDPAFQGLFPGGPQPGGPGGPHRSPRGHSPLSGLFSRHPGPPPPGPRGAPPHLSGPDYDDSPKHGIAKSPEGGHRHSFPDNPFATIPENPFSPRLGLPVNTVDETQPATAPEYYDTQQDTNKDYYNY